MKPLRLYIAFALHGGKIRGVLFLVGGGRVVVFFCIGYWVSCAHLLAMCVRMRAGGFF